MIADPNQNVADPNQNVAWRGKTHISGSPVLAECLHREKPGNYNTLTYRSPHWSIRIAHISLERVHGAFQPI